MTNFSGGISLSAGDDGEVVMGCILLEPYVDEVLRVVLLLLDPLPVVLVLLVGTLTVMIGAGDGDVNVCCC